MAVESPCGTKVASLWWNGDPAGDGDGVAALNCVLHILEGSVWHRAGSFTHLGDDLETPVCGVSWSNNSEFLFVAAPRPDVLYKLDARNDLKAVAIRPFSTPDTADHILELDTLQVSENGGYATVSLRQMDSDISKDQLLVFRSTDLSLVKVLRVASDAVFVGKGYGNVIRYFSWHAPELPLDPRSSDLASLFKRQQHSNSRASLGFATVGPRERGHDNRWGHFSKMCSFGDGMLLSLSILHTGVQRTPHVNWYAYGPQLSKETPVLSF